MPSDKNYNQRRKERYATDADYRQKVKDRAKAYQKNLSPEAKKQGWQKLTQRTALKDALSDDFTSDKDIFKHELPTDADIDTLESNDTADANAHQESNEFELKNLFRHFLTPDEAYILTTSSGLFGTQPTPLEEIAPQLGMTRERVRRTRELAIKKLRDYAKYLPNPLRETKKYNNMKKNIIRLTESELHNLIKESVKQIVNEIQLSKYDDNYSPYDEEMPEWYAQNEDKINTELDRLEGMADEAGISVNDPRYRRAYNNILRKYQNM